jgi:hypothetical protein
MRSPDFSMFELSSQALASKLIFYGLLFYKAKLLCFMFKSVRWPLLQTALQNIGVQPNIEAVLEIPSVMFRYSLKNL